ALRRGRPRGSAELHRTREGRPCNLMAAETHDYEAVLRFINRAKAQECFVPSPEMPEPLCDELSLPRLIPYLDMGLAEDHGTPPESERGAGPIQVFATRWTELDGVMLVRPETEFQADVRVALAARNERALRDLLLSFPSGKVGFFYLGGDWMLPALEE